MKVKSVSIGDNLFNKKKNALPNTSKLIKPKKFKPTANNVQNTIPRKNINRALTESMSDTHRQLNQKAKHVSLELSIDNMKANLKSSKMNKTSSSGVKKTSSKSLMKPLEKCQETAPENEMKLSKKKPNHKEPNKALLKRQKPRNSKQKQKSALDLESSGNYVKNRMEQDSLANQSKLISDKVSSAVAGLLKLTQEKIQKKAGLLDLEEPILMQVECIKIPICPTKQLRLKLPHPLVNELSDILLITADKKGSKIYPEKAVDHYTDLLAKHNVNFIQKVIPIRTLREEYSQFELRRKLVDQFDVILAEAKIIRCLPARLGKFICFNRKMPIPVHLDRNNLKEHLESALSKTQMTVKSTGPVSVVQVGHTKMTDSEITANILEVSKGLATLFPGGWENIRSLNIKTATSTSLPVYLSLLSPNMVRIPVEQKKKQREVEGELSTMPGINVVVRSDGTVYLKKMKDEKPEDDEFDNDILAEAEKYMQSSKTIRYDDDNDNSDKEADALTAAVEKEFLSDYTTARAKETEGKDEKENEEEEEESSDEEIADIPIPVKKRKKESGNKKLGGKSPSKKQKIGQQQQKLKNKDQSLSARVPGNGNKGINKRRGARGGKKNKMNKDQRKAMIKRKKAGKK